MIYHGGYITHRGFGHKAIYIREASPSIAEVMLLHPTPGITHWMRANIMIWPDASRSLVLYCFAISQLGQHQ